MPEMRVTEETENFEWVNIRNTDSRWCIVQASKTRRCGEFGNRVNTERKMVTTMEDMKSMKFRNLVRIDGEVLINPLGESRPLVLPRLRLMFPGISPS
jgi:hypothetical protein